MIVCFDGELRGSRMCPLHLAYGAAGMVFNASAAFYHKEPKAPSLVYECQWYPIVCAISCCQMHRGQECGSLESIGQFRVGVAG